MIAQNKDIMQDKEILKEENKDIIAQNLEKDTVKKERQGEKLIIYITQDEFEKVFNSCKDKEVRLSLLLAFESGLRISEIVGFKRKDGSWKVPPLTKDRINLIEHNIKIFGKGNKERVVPLPKRFNLNAYNMLPLEIPRRTLQDKTMKLCNKVLNKKLSFHKFRHGFGSHLAGKGRPLHEIQYLMGHSRLDTTGIYLHSNPKQTIEAARDSF
jgi:integrase